MYIASRKFLRPRAGRRRNSSFIGGPVSCALQFCFAKLRLRIRGAGAGEIVRSSEDWFSAPCSFALQNCGSVFADSSSAYKRKLSGILFYMCANASSDRCSMARLRLGPADFEGSSVRRRFFSAYDFRIFLHRFISAALLPSGSHHSIPAQVSSPYSVFSHGFSMKKNN